MAEYLIKDTTLTEIADAIRVKTETTDSIIVSDMASKILDISGEGATLVVTAPAEVTVTITKGSDIYNKMSDSNGIATFTGLESGTWTVTITDGVQTASVSVKVIADYATTISFNAIPEFTYDGDYQIVNDSDEEITETTGNWKIRFLTSGTLKFTNLNSAANGIDVFLVGGGGGGATGGEGSAGNAGGGGGGYTKTETVNPNVNQEYEITVGAGGSAGVNGGTSSAFMISADGGRQGFASSAWVNSYGGDGGSGGGGPGYYQGGNGGSDGDNGDGASGGGAGGSGQNTTTREFGEEGATLYAGGGGGGATDDGYAGAGGDGGGGHGGTGTTGSQKSASEAGSDNLGGGGGGGFYGSRGGSGIVIIRNTRGVA